MRQKSHKGAVISGPRVKGVPFGNDAKGIEFPSGESIDLGQYKTIMKREESYKGTMLSRAIGGVLLCFPSPLKIDATLGLTITYVHPDRKYMEAARFIFIGKLRVAYHTCEASFIIALICMTCG